jgi:1-phosphofructokinase family hexose kinase
MFYTLTTNPAIDINMSTKSVKPDIVNRTSNATYSANGKGLNVSFVLKHFGVNSTILGFFGGFSGTFIVNEAKKSCKVLPVWVDDTTRLNFFVNDGKDEYKFVNEGSFVTEDNQKELLKIIEDAEDMEYLSISGSLPKGINPDYYEDILKICRKKQTKVILDISSVKLNELLQYNPYMIKPNDEEIQKIFGIIIRDEEDIKDVLDLLYEKGAQNILLTLGSKGSYFYNGRNIYFANTKPVKLVSSACAGDSALAAFLSVWNKDPDNIEEALKLSAAAGANVAESSGIGDLKNVELYKEQIKVRKVR